MTVRQCPRCELRFRVDNELRSHLVDEHGVDPDALDRRADVAYPLPPDRADEDDTSVPADQERPPTDTDR